MHRFVEALESRQLLSVSLASIGTVNSPAGKTVIVPVDATTNSTGVSYKVTTSNTNITAKLVTGLKFVQMNISINGVAQTPLVFALFGSYTPKTVAHIQSLVEDGFYNGKSFHRIVTGFMAQGGAVSVGEDVSNIDDEFNPNLIFSSKYLLAMANANQSIWADTNTSQFFITSTQTRGLDFRHTIFGTLVSGIKTFQNIMAKGVPTQEGVPTGNVIITSAKMIANTTDTVLAVTAKYLKSGTVTITATDKKGAKTIRSFTAKGVQETVNDPPYLNPMPVTQTTYKNVSVSLPASATDIEGNTPYLSVMQLDADSSNTATLNQVGNNFIVTPPTDFVGTLEILIGVYQYSSGDASTFDTQRVTITVVDADFASVNGDGTLQIGGTTSNDVINVLLGNSGTTYEVSLNDRTLSFPVSDVQQIAIDAGAGNDSVRLSRLTSDAAGLASVTLGTSILGGAGRDTLQGGSGNDTISGGNDNDSINGDSGADLIHGDAGNDSLWGGSGNDLLYGDAGNDWIDAGTGNDTIRGGAGNDLLTGGAGSDMLYGEDGNDILMTRDSVRDTLSGGVGTDSGKWDSTDRRLDSLTLLT